MQAFVRLLAYLSIVVLDLLIVISLHKQRNNVNLNASTVSTATMVKSGSTTGALEAGARRLRASRSVTKTLILSSVFFVVTQALEIVMSILVLCNNPPVCTYQITMKFLLIYSPVQVMLSTSYFACSFFVYISPMTYLRSRKKKLPPRNLLASCGTISYGGSTSAVTGSSAC